MIFKKIFLPFLILALVLGLILSLSNLKIFTIKKITCQLDGYPCPLDFEPVLVNFYHTNIFKLTRQFVSRTMLQFDPALTEIKVDKKLPNQLFISLKRHQAVAQLAPFLNLEFVGLDSSQSATLAGQMQDKLFSLDKDGDIISLTNSSPLPLPLVAVPENFDLSLAKSATTEKMAELVSRLQEHYVSFQLLAWLDSDISVVKTSLGSYAIINPHENLDSQVASLQYILSRFKIGEDLPAKIDLRFDKPVLTF